MRTLDLVFGLTCIGLLLLPPYGFTRTNVLLAIAGAVNLLQWSLR